MAHDKGRLAVRHAPEVALDLGAADPGRARADDHGAGIRRGFRTLLELHPARTLPDQGFH